MLCRMKDKKLLQTLIIVLGLVSIGLGVIMAQLLPEEAHNLVRFAGMITGFGTGIILVGAFLIIKDKWTPEEKKREREIELNDERNIQINRAAYTVVVCAAYIIQLVLAFVFVLMGDFNASVIMICAIYLEAITYVVAYRIISKRM